MHIPITAAHKSMTHTLQHGVDTATKTLSQIKPQPLIVMQSTLSRLTAGQILQKPSGFDCYSHQEPTIKSQLRNLANNPPQKPTQTKSNFNFLFHYTITVEFLKHQNL